MDYKRYLALSVIFVAVLAPGIQGTPCLFQWWTGYLSNLWSTLWNIASGYFRVSPISSAGVSAEQQFSGRLSTLQNNTQNFTRFYVSNAEAYAKQFSKEAALFSINQTWSIQITDQNSTSSPVIGTMTVTWFGNNDTLSMQSGIVNSSISETFSVTASHKAFMALSSDALKVLSSSPLVSAAAIASAFSDFLTYNSTHSLSYRWVG